MGLFLTFSRGVPAISLPEVKERLFNPFFTTKAAVPGPRQIAAETMPPGSDPVNQTTSGGDFMTDVVNSLGRHPLNQSFRRGIISQADDILAIEMNDLWGAVTGLQRPHRSPIASDHQAGRQDRHARCPRSLSEIELSGFRPLPGYRSRHRRRRRPATSRKLHSQRGFPTSRRIEKIDRERNGRC